MAIAPFQFYTSTASVREDLIPDITIISPDDTPFTARIRKGKATQRTHEWLTDALESRTAQTTQVEGAVFASSTRSARTRLSNYTEILNKSWTISGSVEVMDTVSQGKQEFRYQSDLRRKELANGIEYRHLGSTSTGTVGASGTAAQMKAVLPFITTNYSSATANRTLTLDMVNDVLQSCWSAGGSPGHIFCGGARKRNLVNINSTSYGDRQIPSKGGIVEQRVDVFMGEFGGQQEVVLSRDIDANTYGIFEMSRWVCAWLRQPHVQAMGKEGDRRSAQWVAEYTLESRAENANGKIGQISG